MEKNIQIKALLLTDQIAPEIMWLYEYQNMSSLVGQNYVESSSLSVGTFKGGKSVLKLKISMYTQ